MQVLYIDNFRGFEKTFLSLKEVNFFVGENSTGKSSLLKLIGIITSPGFWRYQPFNNVSTENDLGSFSEIISSGTSNKEYFEIGILSQATGADKLSVIRLKFIEDYKNTQLPILKEVSLVNNGFHCQAIIDGSLLRYRFDKTTTDASKDSGTSLLRSWLNDTSLNNKPFYKEKVEFIGIITIVNQLRSLIVKEHPDLDGLNANKVSFTLNTPSFLEDIAVFAPIRTDPLKNYSNQTLKFDPSGKHTPYILNGIIDNKEVEDILKRFGEDSGLFDAINIERLSNEQDRNFSFELQVALNNRVLNIKNVGYGVSQILPIVVEVIARPIETWFALQQPEIHLHPRAQAALGDFIFKSNIRDLHRFIIETHSDYIIDRFRIRINRAFKQDAPINLGELSQVVFFTRHAGGNKLEAIEIQADGSFPDDQPKEFKAFFVKEQLQLITI
jgi:predicted ATPase